MASKLKLTELLYPTSTTAAITINSDDSVTIPTQSTTNLAYTGTLTGGTGVVNLGSGQVYKDAAGNVGIGTVSPITTFGKSLHLYNNASTGTVASNAYMLVESSTRNAVIDLSGSSTATNGVNFSDTPGTTLAGIACEIANQSLFFRTGGTSERMRIDSSGNVGIGVTPSAWDAGYEVLQNRGGAFWSGSTAAARLTQNTYFATSYKYVNTAAASMYAQVSGAHQWHTAPSGTAGNAITFSQKMLLDSSALYVNGIITTDSQGTASSQIRAVNTGGTFYHGIDTSTGASFGSAYAAVLWHSGAYPMIFATSNAEKMRLTSDGNLLVGTQSALISSLRRGISVLAPSGTFVAAAFASDGGASAQTMDVWNKATSGNNSFIAFSTEASATERGSISYNRAGGLTAYNTTSDRRAKDILGNVTDSGELVDSLKVYNGIMKGATIARPMLIADEAQAITPYAVTGEKDAVDKDGNPVFQQIDVSSYVPLLIAELQSLRKRVAELESI